MNKFDDRGSAFENKFALDEALMFKAEARCCKLFGLWIAGEMELSGDDANAYAAKIVGANLEEVGFEDVKRAIAPDIAEKGITLSEEKIDEKLEELFELAQKQIKEEAA